MRDADADVASSRQPSQARKGINPPDSIHSLELCCPLTLRQHGVEQRVIRSGLPDPYTWVQIAQQDCAVTVDHEQRGILGQFGIGHEVVEPRQVHGGIDHGLGMAISIENRIAEIERGPVGDTPYLKLPGRGVTGVKGPDKIGASATFTGSSSGTALQMISPVSSTSPKLASRGLPYRREDRNAWQSVASLLRISGTRATAARR